MKISNVWKTFTVLCIPIVFHGTLEGFIMGWTTIKIFFSVAYRRNYNFWYIIRFIKKKTTRLSLKNYMCLFKKKVIIQSDVVLQNAQVSSNKPNSAISLRHIHIKLNVWLFVYFVYKCTYSDLNEILHTWPSKLLRLDIF
jgi:hypothetical protein